MTLRARGGASGARAAKGRAGSNGAPAVKRPSFPNKLARAIELSAVRVLPRNLRRSKRWRPVQVRRSPRKFALPTFMEAGGARRRTPGQGEGRSRKLSWQLQEFVAVVEDPASVA